MDLQYEMLNSTNEIQFLKEEIIFDQTNLVEQIQEIDEFNQELMETIQGDNGTAVSQETEGAIQLFGEESTGNAYVDNCNLGCHKNCINIKKRVPFPVLEMCVKDKCNCDHSLALANPAPICSTSCRDNCLNNSKFYVMGGNQSNMVQCVQACGCEPEITLPVATEAQLTLMATI
jgi:hypothetical protein